MLRLGFAASCYLALIFVNVVNAQKFVPEYCDWPPFPITTCVPLQFRPTPSTTPNQYAIQWQLWSALTSPSNNNEPFISSNYFRYVTTDGIADVGLTARSQTDLLTSTTRFLCIRFYYYVSAATNQLAIYLVEKSTTNVLTTSMVWSLPTNAQVGSWVQGVAEATLTSTTSTYYIQLEATSTGVQRADSAIARLSIAFQNSASESCLRIIEEDIIQQYVSFIYFLIQID